MIVFAGIIAGQTASLDLSYKVRFIEEYMEFIKTLENEIRYRGTYLEQIVKNEKRDGTFYKLLQKCGFYMANGEPFPLAWEKTFSLNQNSPPLSKCLSEIIINFGLKLGTSDIEGQLSHCEYNYQLIKPYLKRAREEKIVKGKLYKVLGMCAGSAIALFVV